MDIIINLRKGDNIIMLNQHYIDMCGQKSVIRELFMYGRERASEIGYENVFDYSLGNPSVAPPQSFTDQMVRLLKESEPVSLHGYSPTLGIDSVREAVAQSLNDRFDMHYEKKDIFMVSGAAGAIAHAARAVTVPGDKIITFAPYFPEYGPYIEATGAVLKVVPADISSFQINFDAFLDMLDDKVMAVLINTPNNPSGIVYSTETIDKLAMILSEKEEEFGHPIYIISDEPYREIVFGGVDAPFIASHYNNTLTCYSFSKSLSLPGERIGYIAVNPASDNPDEFIKAVTFALRVLGCVNAPAFFQKVIAKSWDAEVDYSSYKTRRDILMAILDKCGIDYFRPQGAFYLFCKVPSKFKGDDSEFTDYLKKYLILAAPGAGFGGKGYFRLAYCVSEKTIRNSEKAFMKAMEELK